MIKPTFKNKMTKDGEDVSLTISGVTLKMAGIYRCVATNRAGEAACENVVKVTEKMEPPKITQKPLNKDVKQGAKAKFEAKATGKPLPEIEW